MNVNLSYLFYFINTSVHKIISATVLTLLTYNIKIKVPIVIKSPPTNVCTVNASFRMKKAKTIVITTLNLSIGTTLEASPICKALK